MKQSISVALPVATSQNPIITHTINSEYSRLKNFILKRVPTAEDAEDILQDVFYQFIEAHRLMKPIERVTSWLFTVARNKITDKYRKKKPMPFSKAFNRRVNDEGDQINIEEILPDTRAANGENQYFKKMVWQAMNQALKELPKEQRFIYVKHEFEGISFNDLSAQTGEPVNTLLSRKRYAVLHLRKSLRPLYNEMNEV